MEHIETAGVCLGHIRPILNQETDQFLIPVKRCILKGAELVSIICLSVDPISEDLPPLFHYLHAVSFFNTVIVFIVNRLKICAERKVKQKVGYLIQTLTILARHDMQKGLAFPVGEFDDVLPLWRRESRLD